MRRPAAAAAAALLLLAAPSPAQGPLALTADSVRVLYWPGDEGIARRTLSGALAPLPLPGIGTRPGLRAGTVVLAPDPQTLDSITGGRAPEWAAGVAFPDARVIVLPAYPSPRTRAQDPITALRHELVHLALRGHLGPNVPRWFDEGYATWASGEWDGSAGWQIRLALLRGVAPPLDSLSLRWPASEPQARLAYLLSASAVEFLATRGGEPAFRAFLESWRRRRSIDAALRETYLTTFERFERDWRVMVRQRYGWLLALAQVGFFWGFAAFLFFTLGFLRRRRNRERMAAMAEEERRQPPEESPEWAASEPERFVDPEEPAREEGRGDGGLDGEPR